jgi:hypothetical protein
VKRSAQRPQERVRVPAGRALGAQPGGQLAGCLLLRGPGLRHGTAEQALHAGAKARVIAVDFNRKHLAANFGGDAKHLVVVLGGFETHGFVQQWAGMVAYIHGGVHSQNEETDPQQIDAAQQFGL